MAPAPRIVCSARSSRSSVVTPGRAASRSRSRVRQTTSPASRISRISDRLLISTCSRRIALVLAGRLLCSGLVPERSGPGGVLVLVAMQRIEGPIGHVVDRSGRIDTYQDASRGVEGHERRRLLRVDVESVPHRAGLVVVALEQLAAIAIAHA